MVKFVVCVTYNPKTPAVFFLFMFISTSEFRNFYYVQVEMLAAVLTVVIFFSLL